MARTAYFDASAGNVITIGTVDGVDISALRALILAHPHVLTLDTHSESEANLPMRNSADTWRACVVKVSGGADQTATCTGGPRSHSHTQGTMAVASTTATTALSPKANDYIEVLHANGDLVCDLIDGYCPFVMYDRYDGHSQTVSGVPGDYMFPPMQAHKVGDSTANIFLVARDNSGTSATYQTAYTHGSSVSSTHGHTISSASLAAYNAPAGAGVDDGGGLVFKIEAATGNITLNGDVNDIGIAQFYADYLAHVHVPSGTSSTLAATDARVFGSLGDSYSFFRTYFDGTYYWEAMYINAGAHNHALVCGVPS